MDPMDIDPIVEVPDTPDRFSKQGINGRNGVKVENNRSSLPFHGQQRFSEEGSRDQPMIIDSGSRGRTLRPPKRTNSPVNARHLASFSSASSSSSRIGHIFRKGMAEKHPRHLHHDIKHKEHLESIIPPCSEKSSSLSSQNDDFIDLTTRNLHTPLVENASPSGVHGNNRADIKKRLGLANGTSLHGMRNFRTASSISSEGTNNEHIVDSNIGFREGVDFVSGDNKDHGNTGFPSLDPIAPPRVNKQKRLVRNGCISPNNIAKANQPAGKDVNCSVAVAHDNGAVASIAPTVSVDIRELVAEDRDSHTRKGKGVVSLPCSSKGPEHNKYLNNSSSSSRSIEESGGWRSTHSLTREINQSPENIDALRYSTQRHENRLQRREKGISIANREELSFISSDHDRPPSESVSHPRARLGRINGPRSSTDSLIKRQKQGSTSSSRGECSRSVPDDVVLLSSSAEAGNSKCTSNNVYNLPKIIEVDEISPQSRQDAHDEDARARQLEADELLARELQEQFYNEMPVFGEVDEHIALALQHQEGSTQVSSQRSQPVPDARLASNLHRQSQPRSSSNAPRRGALSRASTLGRMTRLRSRFPGQPRTLLPSRGRTSMFPPDMDVDMRMHILGALEEFSDMGMNVGILQADRDFNEDDYEMLLALDENNHQHGGASIHQINGLPQSTVQSDNFEEACAICLDTPTVGDTIRHLPCLHKFHKDCIDPWLRRRTSCPVCKSSIT